MRMVRPYFKYPLNFLFRFKVGNGCWVWHGRVNDPTKPETCQYGTLRVNRKSILAHRLSYELFRGIIPRGKLILHRCNYGPCVRPSHLYIGTYQDNANDTKAVGHFRGNRYGQRKLRESDIPKIRMRLQRGDRQVDIAADFGVLQPAISAIKVGAKWRTT